MSPDKPFDERSLPPPEAKMSGSWTAGAIVLLVLGSMTVRTASENLSVQTALTLAVGMVAVVSGVMMLLGHEWARWPGLAALIAALFGLGALTVAVLSEKREADQENMTPIALMGLLMIAAATVTAIVLLAATPRSRRPVPASWLRDPLDPTMIRRWDGNAWTNDRLPAPSLPPPGQHRLPAPPPQPGPPSSYWPGPTTWSD